MVDWKEVLQASIEKDLHDDNFEEFLINMMLVELQEMQKLVGAPKIFLGGFR
jgi:hypothetical protein